MLSELIEIIKFFSGLLEKYKSRKTGCRALLTAYESCKELINHSEHLLTHFFQESIDHPALNYSSQGKSPVQKWVEYSNEDFEALDRAAKKFIEDIVAVGLVLEITDPNLKDQANMLIEEKRGWLSRFRDIYISGRLNNDGRRLFTKWLRLPDWSKYHLRYLKEDYIDTLVAETIFDDVVNMVRRKVLIRDGTTNVELLRSFQKKLAEYIRQNCSIDDMLV
jgi:hypothetical protein